MKISIIIPAYNEEKNLPKLIKSLRKQNLKGFEIIVVDNNSTDNTFKIAKKLADKAYKYKKQGSSLARNFGAKKASGEIVAFLDSDSIVYPHWIEIVRNAFKDKNLLLISGIGLYESGFMPNAFSYFIFLSNKILTILGNPMLIANNFAIRKDIFLKVGGLDNVVAEDFYLCKKLKKLGNVKGRMDGRMKVLYSSRRIRKVGFFKVLIIWITAAFKKIPLEEYTKHDQLS